MKRLPSLLLTSSLVWLTACSHSPPDQVEKINQMQIPLVLPEAQSPTVSIAHITSIYNNNKQQIDSLTKALKKQYLGNVETKEIFEMDSHIQPVYASLSKLEEMSMVNQQYLKEKNEEGLNKIHLALTSILAG